MKNEEEDLKEIPVELVKSSPLPTVMDTGSRLTSEWVLRDKVVAQACARVQDIDVLARVAPPERFDTFLKFINHIAEGGSVLKFLKDNNVTWEYVSLFHIVPRLDRLYHEARARAEEYKQVLREDEADRRAIEGVTRRKKLGDDVIEEQEYSDQLLVTQLKAGNPNRYAERQKVEHQGVVLNVDLTGLRSKKE